MTETVTSTEAARHLGDLLARIKHKGDRFILTRNNQAIAELHPIPPARRGTFKEVLAALEKLPSDPDFAADLDFVTGNDTLPEDPWH